MSMQTLTRILKPKYWALVFWALFFLWLFALLSVSNIYPRPRWMAQSQQQADDSAQLGRIKEVIDDVTKVKEKIPQRVTGASEQKLFPPAVIQNRQDAVALEGLVIIQGDRRLVAILNGQTVTKGQRLPSGEVVTKITPRSITLTALDGTSQVYSVDGSYAPRAALPLEEKKK